MLQSLRYRNFRLLWIGLLISFAGSFMQAAAILWHVSLLVPDNRRALALGLVGLVRIVPIIVFSLISGVAADVLDRRRLMLATQTAMMLLSGLLAVLTWRGLAVVWPIYLIAAASSAAGAFDLPARQALLPNLVPRADLANAISLNTIMLQLASVAGPALGGLIIARGGVGWAYAFDALSYLTVIGALLLMRGVAREEAPAAGDRFTWASAVEGLRFVFHAPLIRSTMLLDFFATFFSSATALLPIYAQDILKVGASGYGWLYAAPAAGALVASAAMVRSVDRIDRWGDVLAVSVVLYGIATFGFGVSRQFWFSFACLAGTGAADTVSMVLRNLVRQLETPDRLRGRMTGINMIFFMGGPQLGELEAGLVANWLGAVVSVASGGLGCIVATIWITVATPALRSYRREGSRL
ncbi:MAG TPA: MFS transporter [Vicinamibacterales bacterium]|nr:MFS transporter [Vicinamibacterales bacterium]